MVHSYMSWITGLVRASKITAVVAILALAVAGSNPGRPAINGTLPSTPQVESDTIVRPQKETVTETSIVPFTSVTVPDDSLAKGTSVVKTKGVDGVKTRIYEQTSTGEKTLVKEEVTKQPITQVVAVGTR